MVSTKLLLITTLYFTSMKIAHCADTIACTAAADCTSSTQKCIDIDGVNKACVEVCTTDADCGGTAGSCAATTTGDVDGNSGFNVCPLIAQQCLTDTECNTADPTLPTCNLYTLTCIAATTTTTTVATGTTTTAASGTTTTAATGTTTTVATGTTTKAPTTTAKSSSTTCADQVTGGSNDCASLAAYCTNNLYLNLMKEKCPKTCGYCTTPSGSSGSGSTSSGCTDQVTGGSNDCTSMIAYCTNTIYKDLMKQRCPKTCGYCTSSSSGSSSSGGTSSTTCTDALSDCSSKSYLCTNTTYKDLMKQNCPKSCGYCTSSSSSSSSSSSGSTSTGTCKDSSSDCSSKSYLCTNSLYISLMKTNCPLTCGFC
uniref:ShKT domain-containing protein n=1 Tax=Strongyloides papillosus TaxID=174720 RepID=A0A0N5BCB5_STREA